MSTQTTNLTAEQYHIMFETPPPRPTTEQWFEHQAMQYLDANLGVQADVDRLHGVLPASGMVLCVFRAFCPEELTELMTHVVVNGKKGRDYFDLDLAPDSLTNESWVPDGPHLLTDVRDGRDRCNIVPSVSRANIIREGRKEFAVIHLVHWSIYHGQDVLTHHFLDGLASRHLSNGVPYLGLHKDGQPWLGSRWCDRSDPKFGAPCAGSVVVPRD